MRQFGFHQHRPIDVPSTIPELHKIDLRANEHNWPVYHRQYINVWNSRHSLRINGIPIGDFKQGYHDEYMKWYRTITRRWISHNGAMHGSVVDGIEHINIRTHGREELGREDTKFVRDTSCNMLRALREDRRDTIRYVPSRAPPQPEEPANPVLRDEPPHRQTGRRAQPRDRFEPDPRFMIPPPWGYQFPPADAGSAFNTPRPNIVRPGDLYGFGGSSSGTGFQGSQIDYQHYVSNDPSLVYGVSASGSYHRPPSYHSHGPPDWLGENMYTPTPPYGSYSFGPTTDEGGSQPVHDPPQPHDHNEEDAPSTIHKRLRKKKHPKKRGCCPTD
ncbi:Serine/threonine-protein phosphatase 7 long form homolog [Linum perenne]